MIQIRWFPYTLQFRFPAGTSRGILSEKTSYFIHINYKDTGQGIGECGPLKGLSIDDRPDFEKYLNRYCRKATNRDAPDRAALDEYLDELIPSDWPSIRTGFEMAWKDLYTGGRFLLYDNHFIKGGKIPINGLIWMGDEEFMAEQVKQKIDQRYSCIKMKIGAIDFKAEIDILKTLRDQPQGSGLTLRVDANGAFSGEEVLDRLDQLASLNIHSIEQPVSAGQWERMASICRESPIPIALDEELIGVHLKTEKKALLETIKPQYVVLKPTLLGGFNQTAEWIRLAEERNIGWWITSALESNIGLNAIAQFTAQYPVKMEQGLGTGQLYHNNFPSPLVVENGFLRYDSHRPWDLSSLRIN